MSGKLGHIKRQLKNGKKAKKPQWRDLSRAELATILAALRHLQAETNAEGLPDCGHLDELPLAERLSVEDIDLLCEDLNLGSPKVLARE